MSKTTKKATNQSAVAVERGPAAQAGNVPEGDGFAVFMLAPITFVITVVVIIVVSM